MAKFARHWQCHALAGAYLVKRSWDARFRSRKELHTQVVLIPPRREGNWMQHHALETSGKGFHCWDGALRLHPARACSAARVTEDGSSLREARSRCNKHACLWHMSHRSCIHLTRSRSISALHLGFPQCHPFAGLHMEHGFCPFLCGPSLWQPILLGSYQILCGTPFRLPVFGKGSNEKLV